MQERTEAREGQETRAPITIIPTRRALGDQQIAQLQHGLQTVQAEIQSLQTYFNGITIPPAERSVQAVLAGFDLSDAALTRMGLTSYPVLGERYRNEIDTIRENIRLGREAARAGRIVQAVEILDRVNAQIGMMGRIFDIELRILMGGLPANIHLPNVAPENAMNAVFDGLESVILVAHTPNEHLANNVFAAANLYAANAAVYNADNESARAERDNIFLFIRDRGAQAREGRAYTEAQQREDARMLRSFQDNMGSLQSQMRDYNASVFVEWRSDIAFMIRQETDTQVRRNLESLQSDLDAIVRRVRGGSEVSQDEIREISGRYFLLSGKTPPATADEREQRMRDSATALRGTSRTVADGSPEWYGQRALDLLGQGDARLAALAISMGMLERSSGRGGAASHVQLYWDIRDAIASGITPPAGLMSRYTSQVEIASLSLDVQRIRSDYARGGAAEKRQRILAAADVIAARLASGDVAGARRLLDMVTAYGDLLSRNNWRPFTGSEQMEAAIDSERNGRNAEESFGNALSYHSLMAFAAESRSNLRQWGRGLSAQSEVANEAFRRVEELGAAGDIAHARRLLTMLVMYIDSIQRLGVRRGNQIVSLNEAGTLEGMASALRVISAGGTAVGERNAADVFAESYGTAQRAYVNREADRLATLTARREAGRDDLNAALEMARQRATRGDYPGALLLLQMVSEFYGAPQPGREAVFRQEGGRRVVVSPPVEEKAEGWRYSLFTGRNAGRIPGYVNARRGLLEAIRLEMNATDDRTHQSASQLFDQSTRLVSETEYLISQHLALTQRFGGTIPFVNDRMDTVGQIPLGELQQNNRFADYIPLSFVRQYETSHAQDPALRGGRTIDDLLAAVYRAAASGDRNAYNYAVGQLNARFDVVVRRAVRQRTIDQMRTQVGTTRTALQQMRDGYPTTGEFASLPSQRRAEIDNIRRSSDALLSRLDAIESTTDELPLQDYSSLIARTNQEGRLAATFSYLTQQIGMTEQFRRAVASERDTGPAGDLPSRTAARIRESGDQMRAALNAVARNDLPAAFSAYRNAVYIRTDAMIFYRAEETPTTDQVSLSDVLTLHPLPRPRPTDLYHVPGSPPGDFIDTRFFGGMRFTHAEREFVPYRQSQLDVFSSMLTGFADGFSGDRTVTLNAQASRTLSQQELENRARAASTIEISTFGCPQAAPRSIILTDYVPRQREIRTAMNEILTGRAADTGQAMDSTMIASRFTTGDAGLRWMQDRAQRDDKIATYTMIGVGIAALFVPKVGWAISGAIFIGLAADRVALEYRVDGHASTEAWAMLGLSVATLGLAGAAQGVGRLALAARAAGYTRLATGAAYTATGMRITAFGLGIGLTGYGIYSGVRALRAGRTEEGLVNIGLALIPIGLMGRAAISSYRGRIARPTVSGEMAEALDTATASDQVPVRISVTEPEAVARVREYQQQPNRLLRFIRDYLAADESGRTRLMESIPTQLRPVVEGLAGNADVANAARAMGQRGAMAPLEAARVIRETLSGIELPREPGPGGPTGSRPQTDVFNLMSSPSGLRQFIADLLVPDTAAQPALEARAAALSRLRAIRAENPDAAAAIDTMMADGTATRNDITQGQTRFTNNIWTRAAANLRSALPDDVAANLQRQQMAYERQMLNAVGYNGPLAVDVPVEQPAMGMQPRAMASGGEGGPRGPTVRPPVSPQVGGGVEAGGGRPQTPRPGRPARGGAPVEAPPEQAPQAAAPEELLRPGETRKVGWFTLAWRSVGAWRARRAAARADRALRLATPEDFLAEARSAMEETLSLVARSGQRRIMIDEVGRTLDAATAGEVGNTIETAPQRLAQIVRSLYARATDRSVPRAQREAAMRALVRIYSYDNARGALSEIARGTVDNPVGDLTIARALRLMDQSARSGAANSRTPLSLDNFLARSAREGMQPAELDAIIDTLTVENTSRIARASARIQQLEGSLIPRAQDQYEAARRTAEAATGNAKARAEQRQARLGGDLFRLREELATLRAQVRSPEARALARAESLIGINLRPLGLRVPTPNVPEGAAAGGNVLSAESAAQLRAMHGRGLVPADQLVFETVEAGNRLSRSLRTLENGENQATSRLSVMIERGVGPRGGNADDLVLGALRSDEMFDAVRAQYGERTAAMFRDAVRTGNFDEVMASLRNRLVTDAGEAIAGFASAARTAIAPDLAVISVLGEPATAITAAAMERAGIYVLGQGTISELAWNALMASGRGMRTGARYAGEPFWRWGRIGVERLRLPAERGGQRLAGVGYFAVQLGAWGLIGLGGYSAWQYADRRWFGARDLTEARAHMSEDLHIPNDQVTDRLARFGMTTNGSQFWRALPSHFPDPRTFRPSSREEFERVWDSEDMVIGDRMGEVLSDGEAMCSRMDEINRLLQTRRTGSEQERNEAQTRLNTLVADMHLKYDGVEGIAAVERILSRRNRQALQPQDFVDLRMSDWIDRGIAYRFRDGVVEAFLTDNGVDFKRRDATTQFLTSHRDVYEALVNAHARGNLPSVNMRAAMNALMVQGVYDGLHARVNARNTMDSLVVEALTNAHLYVQITGAGGTTTGIASRSFLDLLDGRTVADPDHGWSAERAAAARTAFNQIVSLYGNDPQAMAALNAFVLPGGDAAENIYGNPTELAQMIVATPQHALERARSEGRVGPAMLGAVDPAMLDHPELVTYAVQHSTATPNQGILEWVRLNREHISRLVPMLQDLSTSTTAAGMNPADLQAYADRQADRYKAQVPPWWRGPTAAETATELERARRRAPPQQGVVQQRPPTRGQQEREAFTPHVTPRRTDQNQPPPPPPAQVTVDLGPQADAFFNDRNRSSTLSDLVNDMVDTMWADVPERPRPGRAPTDGQILRAAYGNDIDRAKREIRTWLFGILSAPVDNDPVHQRAVTQRNAWGFTVSGEGGATRVQFTPAAVRRQLRTPMMEFVRSAQQGGR